MKRWKKIKDELTYSVGMQIGLVLLTTNLIFVMFVVYNHMSVRRVNERYNQEISQYKAILMLKKNFAVCDTLFYDFIRTGNSALAEEYRQQAEEIRQDLQTMSFFNTHDGEEAYLAESIRQSFKSCHDTYETAIILYGKIDYGYYNSVNRGRKIVKYLGSYTDDLLYATLQREVSTSYELQKRQAAASVCNVGITVCITCLILLFCVYIYRNVTVPLNELALKAGEMARGNLNVSVKEQRRRTNVSTTSGAFNQMAESVRRNMENERKNLEYEKLLNEARFLALQTQTNPHFLFNTLNSISRTITLGRNEQAQMMLESLAVLMRYNLADADVPVSLKQEIWITKEYLNIQKMRFRHRIRYEFCYDERIAEEILIPRFTLQPLVENAIIHGITPLKDGGKLILDVKRRGKNAIIRIADNGAGIPRDKLKMLQAGLQENKSKRIGIWNTFQRMTIFTGTQDSFRLLSKEGSGTMVILTLPERGESV